MSYLFIPENFSVYFLRIRICSLHDHCYVIKFRKLNIDKILQDTIHIPILSIASVMPFTATSFFCPYRIQSRDHILHLCDILCLLQSGKVPQPFFFFFMTLLFFKDYKPIILWNIPYCGFGWMFPSDQIQVINFGLESYITDVSFSEYLLWKHICFLLVTQTAL